MARPRLGEKGAHTYGFSVDDETLERIEKLSAELRLSKSAVVRLAVRELYIQTFLRK